MAPNYRVKYAELLYVDKIKNAAHHLCLAFWELEGALAGYREYKGRLFYCLDMFMRLVFPFTIRFKELENFRYKSFYVIVMRRV